MTPTHEEVAAAGRYIAVKAGFVHFALVFGAGFVVGVVRQLWAVPRLGVMWAELAEQPFMLGVIVAAARWTIQRFNVPVSSADRVVMGILALGLMATCEVGIVLLLRGQSLAEYGYLCPTPRKRPIGIETPHPLSANH